MRALNCRRLVAALSTCLNQRFPCVASASLFPQPAFTLYKPILESPWCFARSSVRLSSSFSSLAGGKSLGLGERICSGSLPVAFESAQEDLSDGCRSFGSSSSSMALERNPGDEYDGHLSYFNGTDPLVVHNRQNVDGEVISAGLDVTTTPGGSCTENLSNNSLEPALSSPKKCGDSTEKESCDCTTSGAQNTEWIGSDVDSSLAKRLKTECLGAPADDERERRIAAAWNHWRRIGEPKMHVAPMVDQSELPFRMLCRKYGATAAYTPMLHARLFAEDVKYRSKEFSTCPEDRPLFVQFCANKPETLLQAARLVEADCDYVDINLGCPQRIAKKGNYGAFLMDNLPLVKSLVSTLASNLIVPVSCKIRVFPKLEQTLAYARMLEEAGCSLLAVHGRTRDQKNGKLVRADWEAIQAVKKVLRIPVLGNGNIRWLEDVHTCIASTGVDGVLSAESLLENPALFAGYRLAHGAQEVSSEASSVVSLAGEYKMEQREVLKIDELALTLEYLDLCKRYPVPMRMVRGHVHKILGNFWFKQNPDIRDELNKQYKLTIEWLQDMVHKLIARRASDSSKPLLSQEPQSLLNDALPVFPSQELPC